MKCDGVVRLTTTLNGDVVRWRTTAEQGSVAWQASAMVECDGVECDGAKREQHVKERLKND